MKENIYNIFYYGNDNEIIEFGVAEHCIDGDDETKITFLQQSTITDYTIAKKYPIPKRFCDLKKCKMSHSRYSAYARVGKTINLFSDILENYSAPIDVLCCITAIINDKPEIDIKTGFKMFSPSNFSDHEKIGKGKMPDYLVEYQTEKGFDLPKLLNNDYFLAIKILFTNQYYVSSLKLLLSFIDTISYIEFGDAANSFILWLSNYVDLSELNITSTQLWELRNSVLHMTNLDSRKNIANKEKRISIKIGGESIETTEFADITYFDLGSLLEKIAKGLEIWIKTYNNNGLKWITFVERYDRTISDTRLAISKTHT